MAGSRYCAEACRVPATPGLPDLPPGPALVGSFAPARGHEFAEHAHPTHQLAWASRGVLRVAVGATGWVLTPGRALWIPAGYRHVTGATESAAMRGIYLPPERAPVGWAEPTVLAVGPLLAALIDHLGRTDLDREARVRAEAVLFDQLEPAPGATVRLPWPTDPRARAVADALAADPSDDRDAAAWGRAVGAGGRTPTRLFVDQTGLGPGRWRTLLRVRTALELLAAGHPVGAVAHRVGYRTTSAFVAAFRRATGSTPGGLFRADGR